MVYCGGKGAEGAEKSRPKKPNCSDPVSTKIIGIRSLVRYTYVNTQSREGAKGCNEIEAETRNEVRCLKEVARASLKYSLVCSMSYANPSYTVMR